MCCLHELHRALRAKPCADCQTCRPYGTKVANRLADKLQLDDRTQQWFVPLYAAYQDTLMGIRRTYRMGKPAGKGQGKQAGVCALNDAEALQCVENALKRDELTLKVKRDYYAQFKKQLTPQQGQRGHGHHQQGHGAGWQQTPDFD